MLESSKLGVWRKHLHQGAPFLGSLGETLSEQGAKVEGFQSTRLPHGEALCSSCNGEGFPTAWWLQAKQKSTAQNVVRIKVTFRNSNAHHIYVYLLCIVTSYKWHKCIHVSCLRLDLILQHNTPPMIDFWIESIQLKYSGIGHANACIHYCPKSPLTPSLKPQAIFCRTCSPWRNENGLSWSLKSAAKEPPQDWYSKFSSDSKTKNHRESRPWLSSTRNVLPKKVLE